MFEASEPYIQDIWRELKANGYNPEITQYNFCTNGSHYAGEAELRQSDLVLPRENLAHTIGEYIELDQLVKAADCYKIVMKALLK